jgi:hypothetical protein
MNQQSYFTVIIPGTLP